ncbi:MAG TPA: hypothetical protein DCQ64_04870 [Candidatus Rokubacteria bacterium]|nr:hypothetical protein [Candidatus Rokubacteria bacterium]
MPEYRVWKIPNLCVIPSDVYARECRDVRYTSERAAATALRDLAERLATDLSPSLGEQALPWSWWEGDQLVDHRSEYSDAGATDAEYRVIETGAVREAEDGEVAVLLDVRAQRRWLKLAVEHRVVDGVAMRSVAPVLVPVSDWMPAEPDWQEVLLYANPVRIELVGSLDDLRPVDEGADDA